jgi:putative selenate reductase
MSAEDHVGSEFFQPLPRRDWVRWIAGEWNQRASLFGVPRGMFFRPGPDDPFAQELYGARLETPFGVAAGPHTQMAQNILVAWACGARFIELKTVQTLDRLEVPKPCIDMQDEGYNVEWSQELTLDQSFEEYLRAWAMLHVLHRRCGFPGERPGAIFNMSVGYNLDGILKPNVQHFLRRMQDAGDALRSLIEEMAPVFPDVRDIDIPARISNNVTLSTMHGCPPEEIGRIARYMIEEWGLHTSVKLNPTLLGPDSVRGLLRDLGYTDIVVPDLAFEHDLKYPDAIALICDLERVAASRGVAFGVKLSNTLETENRRPSFSRKEAMAYLSGRPLHAITVNLAAKLQEEFAGRLLVSFAGGADAFNADRLLACGMRTVTACSDLLRPGSYTRLLQYISNTAEAFAQAGARSLEAFVVARAGAAGVSDPRACALANLRAYAREVRADPLLRRDRFDRRRTKTIRPLGLFDCIQAPCNDACAVGQRVPLYMKAVREGRIADAIEIVRRDNPLGAILGRACNHPCQAVCTRVHYDDPLAIREIKRFIMDQERPAAAGAARRNGCRVAIVGAGPCGLGAAWFLAAAGYAVTVFEKRAYAGGMVAGSIPGYRATADVIRQDIERLQAIGVEFRFNQCAGRDITLASLRAEGFRYIVAAGGAQRGQRLGIPGEDAAGVIDALDFLRGVREGRIERIGRRVGVVGGGDVAMDCARTAWRLGADDVCVIYRRTKAEMPAQYEERRGLEAERIPIRELLAPKEIVVKDGALAALVCARMRLGEPDASGRRRPIEIPGETERLPLDTLVVAISQQADLSLFGDEKPAINKAGFVEVDPATLRTSIPDVYAGGDLVQDGPATIVKAVGDGKRIAHDIRRREEGVAPDAPVPPPADVEALLRKRAVRRFQVRIDEIDPAARRNFREITLTLSREEAIREAERCLDCNVMCSTCVAVCPNLAFMTYRQEPMDLALATVTAKRGRIDIARNGRFAVRQALQVAVLKDFCNACGNCATFCPTAGAPYRDKPRLFASRTAFESEPDNAFRLVRASGADGIQARWGGVTHELWWNGELDYRASGFRLRLDPATFEVLRADAERDGALRNDRAAAMYALLRGLRSSMAFLPVGEMEAR